MSVFAECCCSLALLSVFSPLLLLNCFLWYQVAEVGECGGDVRSCVGPQRQLGGVPAALVCVPLMYVCLVQRAGKGFAGKEEKTII